MLSMKVITVKNKSKPKEAAYDDVDVIMVFESHNRKFALHRSYNALISCYMLSEYSTGCVFTAFGIPKLDITEAEIDRVVERSVEYLNKLDEETITDYIGKLATANVDDPEPFESPDYSDVEVAKRLKRVKEKELKQKVEGEKSSETNGKKKAKTKTKPKKTSKKRGRPPKNPTPEMETLI